MTFLFASVKLDNFSNPLPWDMQGHSFSSAVCFFFLSFKITCYVSKVNIEGKYMSGYVITQTFGAVCLYKTSRNKELTRSELWLYVAS